MKIYSKEDIEKAILTKGYHWDDTEKGCSLNIVGIRNSDTGDKVTNLFDDCMTVSYKENGEWVFKQWLCTTEPGKKGVMEFHNAGGVAILVPSQYVGAYIIRLHQNKYEAVCQNKPVKTYRDANKDLIYNKEKITEGIYGINIHHASFTGTSTLVENWSEGCQVFANINDFTEFMKICNRFKTELNNTFTYTLIESKDVISHL